MTNYTTQNKRGSTPRKIIPDGTRINFLTILSRAENTSAGRTQFLCRCDCGTEFVVTSKSLHLHGRYQIKSCHSCKAKRAGATRLQKEHDKELGSVYFGWKILEFIGLSDKPDWKRKSQYIIQHTCGAHAETANLSRVKSDGRICTECTLR